MSITVNLKAAKKKFKTKPSDGKVKLTVFSDSDAIPIERGHSVTMCSVTN
jgi:hypothetical protein